MQEEDLLQIEIVFNGERKRVAERQSVVELLTSFGLDPERLAVELDGSILKRPLWPETIVQHGARLEVVQFVGGG